MALPGRDEIFPGVKMFGHAGDAYGLLSDMFQDPVSGFGLIFITNGYKPGFDYKPGKHSAFERPEEAAFEVFAKTSYSDCVAAPSK